MKIVRKHINYHHLIITATCTIISITIVITIVIIGVAVGVVIIININVLLSLQVHCPVVFFLEKYILFIGSLYVATYVASMM